MSKFLLGATVVLVLSALLVCYLKWPQSNSNDTVAKAQTLKPQDRFITPRNIKYLASSLHSSVSITEEGRIIHVNSGARGQELIRVPLAGPSELDPHTSFKITVGRRNIPSVDSDPDVGLSDGVTTSIFRLHDKGNNGRHSQCFLVNAKPHDNLPMDPSAGESMQYVLMFEPFHRYGACYSAVQGGYVNTGIFTNQLDVSNGVDLIVKRQEADETYDFFYFIVEII